MKLSFWKTQRNGQTPEETAMIETTAPAEAVDKTSAEQKQETKQADGAVNDASKSPLTDEEREQIRLHALGTAAEAGWVPPSAVPKQTSETSRVEMVDGDIPKPPQWDAWAESENQAAMDAYISAVRAARAERGELDSQIKSLSKQVGHDAIVSAARKNVPQEALQHFDSAVAELVKENGGPIPNHPGIERLIQDRAIAIAYRKGEFTKKAAPVGETQLADTSPAPYSPALVQQVKDEFARAGMPVDDKYANEYLRKKGYVNG